MTGAAFIVGLLADRLFMLGAQQFLGIKIAFIVPIMFVAFYCTFLDQDRIMSLKDKLVEWLNSPITVLGVVISLFLLGIAAIYLLRSGNFAMGTMEMEKMARSFLENILIVRPRTKEFLIGYPLLFLGALYYLTGGKKWLWPFLIIGIVAPISTINTFCHVHTPLLVSILRAVYGVVLGIAFGAVYYALFYSSRKAFKK